MSRRSGMPTPAQRRARVRALAATHTRAELAAMLDVSPRTIGNDLRALNITAKRERTVMLARRERVRELAPTSTFRELLEVLGVARATLHQDLKALGIRVKPAVRGRKCLPPDIPPPSPPRTGPRPQTRWCPHHPGVRVGAWGCRACNAQRDAQAIS